MFVDYDSYMPAFSNIVSEGVPTWTTGQTLPLTASSVTVSTSSDTLTASGMTTEVNTAVLTLGYWGAKDLVVNTDLLTK